MPTAGRTYNFVFRANDPVSAQLAADASKAHIQVVATWPEDRVPAFRDGRFVSCVAGSPWRTWEVAVLSDVVNHSYGIATHVDVSADEIAPGVNDAIDWLSQLSRGALAAAHTVGNVVGRSSDAAASDGGGGGGGLSTGVVIGLVLAGLVVVGYVFREPLLSLAKTGAKTAAKAA